MRVEAKGRTVVEWLLVGAAVVVVLLLVASISRRGTRGDEVEQFHRARSMTSGWARSAGATIEEPRPYPNAEGQGEVAADLPDQSAAASEQPPVPDPGAHREIDLTDDQGPTVRQGRDRSSAT